MNDSSFKLNEVDLTLLYAHVCALVFNIAVERKVPPGLLLGPKGKGNRRGGRGVTEARDLLIDRLKSTTRLYLNGAGETHVDIIGPNADPKLPPAAPHVDWAPISSNRLAQLLGVNHVTVLNSMQRQRQRTRQRKEKGDTHAGQDSKVQTPDRR